MGNTRLDLMEYGHPCQKNPDIMSVQITSSDFTVTFFFSGKISSPWIRTSCSAPNCSSPGKAFSPGRAWFEEGPHHNSPMAKKTAMDHGSWTYR